MSQKRAARRVTLEEKECFVAFEGDNVPVQDQLKKHKTISIFRRYQRRIMEKNYPKQPTDGNPLVYAMKEINHYYLSREDKERLWEAMTARLRDCLDNRLLTANDFKNCVVIPSGNSLNDAIQNRLRTFCQQENIALEINEIFDKVTNQEIVVQLENANKEKLDYKSKTQITALKTDLSSAPMDLFSLKKIRNPEIRKILSPLKIKQNFPELSQNILTQKQVLIVDDVLSTGSSLLNAQRILHHRNPKLRFTFLTLFSKSYARK